VTLFESLKLTHVTCAFLSIAGFILRGYWMAIDHPLLQRRPAKVLPHLIDTVLLGSAIAMLVVMRLSPLAAPWLTVKIAALLLYIGLGMVALRFGRTKQVRISAWLLALLTAAYMVAVAYSKSPQGYFAALL
jgi:uncharacterized membrane protein SirB2